MSTEKKIQFENDKEDAPVELSFTMSDENNQLSVVVPCGKNVVTQTPKELLEKLKNEGYGEWQILETAIADVCAKIGKLEQELETLIANRVDGEFELNVSEDACQVFLSISPPQGGIAVSVSTIKIALLAESVSHGVKLDVIDTCVAAATAEKVLIAEASLPFAGEDTVFETLIRNVKDARPKIGKDGRADYREIGSFIVVKENEKLMRKHPAQNGSNGVDVHGKIITADTGENLEFAVRLDGVHVDPNDKDVLIAAIGGQPEIVEQGVIVSPVISVEKVDLSIGNIDFIGVVNIQGDVLEGMKIHATGDIVVAGMVEGAELNAGGNIMITKGVIGRGKLRTENGEPGSGVAQLTAAGSIEARFLENAIVEAAQNITVGELVSHCELSARQHILVGKKGAKKGHILGGKSRATLDVKAQVIGSQSGVKTIIEVGINTDVHIKVKQIKEELKDKTEENVKLFTLITHLKLKKDAKSQVLLKKVTLTQEKMIAVIQKLKEDAEALREQDELTKSAKVMVGKHAFGGAMIVVCDKTHTVSDCTESGVFSLLDGKVNFDIG